MDVTIKIDCDNAAFEPEEGNANFEIARILRKLATRIEADGLESTPLLDFNGNSVGEFTVNEDDPQFTP